MHFHVTGSFELFENNLVHARSGIDQRRGDDGEGSALLDVTGRTEKPFRFMQGVGIDTAGKNFSGVRLDGIVSAGQTGDGIKEDHNILLVLNHAAGFFDDHLSHLNVTLRRFIKGGANHLGRFAGALHVRDFLGTFVDEEDEEVAIRAVLEDGVGQLLHQHRLTGARRGHDQAAGAFADRADQIQHTGGKLIRARFQEETTVGKQRGEVVEVGFVLRFLRIIRADLLNFKECVETFLFLWRTNLALDQITRLEVKAADL